MRKPHLNLTALAFTFTLLALAVPVAGEEHPGGSGGRLQTPDFYLMGSGQNMTPADPGTGKIAVAFEGVEACGSCGSPATCCACFCQEECGGGYLCTLACTIMCSCAGSEIC